ncbi:Regulator of Vps4 activity in the MVB pathway protein isoform 2 [Hibiscus syriacus]|uniref:Regulator of Vps4 activity in the MVB pathway protein isoform 2 n=2 Tax=Hibiscus syriacus TaxID=106335 RepID=A0A6A2XGP6_HIBSY|nr:IST1-like protein isoform X1 [Hibiscus syriacus]KAE8668920.1 Regulator of Vps4 activity in the MVB pathway protein isoform 2 [Hibiscus syriacus]
MAVARIKLLRNKRQVVVKQMRRDIALLLQSGQDATARIRVEHVIREQNVLAANEFIELFCELIIARLSIIKKRRECPTDLKEGIASLIFASPRCAEIPELIEIRNIFEKKYGTDFVSAATDLRPNCGVNRLLIDKLSVKTPTGEAKLKVMKEIAKEHNIEWDTSESETELLKHPEELIEGPRTLVSASSLPVKPATDPFPEPKELMIRGEADPVRFKSTVAAAEAAEESAKRAIAAAQAAAYLANGDSNLFSEASGCVNSTRGFVPTKPPGPRRIDESRSFGTFYAPSSEEVRPDSNEGGKTWRRHSYNTDPDAYSDIKFDESDCDEEIEFEDDLPPPVSHDDKRDSSIHSVHPKLPEYDDLAARFEALKFRKSLP